MTKKIYGKICNGRFGTCNNFVADSDPKSKEWTRDGFRDICPTCQTGDFKKPDEDFYSYSTTDNLTVGRNSNGEMITPRFTDWW